MSTSYTLTGNVRDLVGDLVAHSAQAYLTSNLGDKALVDLDANRIRLSGTVRIQLAADGAFSESLIATNSTGTNIGDGSLRYRVTVAYKDASGNRQSWDSGYFELTGNLDLSDAVAMAYLEPTFTVNADDIVAGLIETPGSGVEAALTSKIAEVADPLAAAIDAEETARSLADGALSADIAAVQAAVDSIPTGVHPRGVWSASPGAYTYADLVIHDAGDGAAEWVWVDDEGDATGADVPGAAAGWVERPIADRFARDEIADLSAEAVRIGDPGIPTTRTAADAIRWRSKVGRRVLATLTSTGLIQPAKGVELGDTILTSSPRTDYLRGTPINTTARTHALLAEDHLLPDGTVPAWAIRRWLRRDAKGRGILCRGDSLTAGAGGDDTTYPGHLSTLVPGVPVAKRGMPGGSSKSIAQIQGSTALVTTSAVTIPASGATSAFSVDSDRIWTGVQGAQGTPDGLSMSGTLNGVRGTLALNGGGAGNAVFTRTVTGAAVDVPIGTPWCDEWESTHRDWNQVIWTGRNNIADAAQLLTHTARMAAYQTAGDYIVLGVINATAAYNANEVIGGANYTTILALNTALNAAYGDRFLDIRTWLIDHGLDAVGITATPTDLDDLADDTPPTSLRAADHFHLNGDGYKAVAIAVHEHITTRGWV